MQNYYFAENGVTGLSPPLKQLKTLLQTHLIKITVKSIIN